MNNGDIMSICLMLKVIFLSLCMMQNVLNPIFMIYKYSICDYYEIRSSLLYTNIIHVAK